jgi:hypothetical protein
MGLSRSARLAASLWIVFAVVAWNVVFDRVIIDAGRLYAKAAKQAARESDEVLLINDWMPQATTRALRLATGVGLSIAITGLAAVGWAARSRAVSPKHLEDLSQCVPPPTR